MTATTVKVLKQLIKDFRKDPENLDLINSIAIGYFENSAQNKDKEDFDYFEKAYELKKTVKSTHNFAWFLYFEWSEIKRALAIQQECVELKPNSYYPYYLYGFMLFQQGEFEKAIEYLTIAKEKEFRRDIEHNIGYCYFKLNDFNKARQCFLAASDNTDIENLSLFNLAITELKLNNIINATQIANRLFETIIENTFQTISGYEIGLLFFLLQDYEKAVECTVKQGIDFIDLLDWNELSYCVYIVNRELWVERLKKGVLERIRWQTEIRNNHEKWTFDTAQEKQERLNEIREEIKIRRSIIKTGIDKPNSNLEENIIFEFCGCLLFDCKRHENKFND
jgi:tetratricopeptide (TPR) repeat protein